MTEKHNSFSQHDQVVQGPQTNIGEAKAPVLSGEFHGPVTIQPSFALHPIPHQIPLPPLDFTGRDEELQELLGIFERGAPIIGLRGLGGVGKSALAFALAERLKDRFPDGQLFVSLQGISSRPLTPADAMAQIIHSYQPTLRLPESEAELANLYRSVLDGKHALLLLDNALDDKQVLNLILPKSCGLLITSRKTIKLPGLIRKDLYVLKPEEALELLLKVWCSTSGSAEPPKTDPAWSEIARLCGFLPLALRAAASLLANTPDLSPANYADELKDERTRLERIGEEGVELSVDASFNLSFQRQASEIQQTFLNASVFPADFDGQAEEFICRDQGHKRLSELTRWSLVEYQRPSQESKVRYHLHDLVRLFAAGRLEVAGGEAARNYVLRKYAEYYKDVLSSANELYTRGGYDELAGLKEFDLEKMNIKDGQKWAQDMVISRSDRTRSSGLDPEWQSVLQLSNDYSSSGASLIELRLNPRERISWLMIALFAAKQLKDRKMEGSHLINLGIAYIQLGENLLAIKILKKGLSIARKIGNRFGESNALGNLGISYAEIGDIHQSIKFFEKHLAIAHEIGDKRGEAADLGNLGLAYAELGDSRRAIVFYEQSLKIDHEIGYRCGEGANLGNLGMAYYDLGDASKAIKYYERHMAIACEIGDRRSEGNTLWNMSLALDNLNERSEAIKKAESALEIFEQIESPAVARVRQKLAEWRK
jgi:tetratricopeptide (TPR) repeat protein